MLDERQTFRCAWCKKVKPTPPAGTGYGYKGKDCCSYHCQRALERADPNSYLSIKERAKKANKVPQETEDISKIERQGHAPKREITVQERKEIAMLFKSGKSISRIAVLMRRSTNTIAVILEKEGARAQPHNRRSRFNQATVDQVNILHLQGMLNKDIAKQLGMSATTVSRMINGVVR